MFTGIVAAIGKIVSVDPQGDSASDGVRLTVDTGGLSLTDVTLGDSIAVNGVCLTVIEKTISNVTFDVSRESLNRTTGLDAIGEVNLEKALTLADRLGGHLVSGHIDGIGKVQKIAAVGESCELVLKADRNLAKYFVYKGSVVVNGVSLTVNRVEDLTDGCLFSINLIPHTLAVTTLKSLQAGHDVNLEVDMIARYVERILFVGKQENGLV